MTDVVENVFQGDDGVFVEILEWLNEKTASQRLSQANAQEKRKETMEDKRNAKKSRTSGSS